MDAEFNDLLSRYSEPYHKARLLAAAAPHSGDWLHTLPISACGLHLEDNAIRALIRAEIPSVREPSGLSRDDGKSPDGLTLVPWQSGRSVT